MTAPQPRQIWADRTDPRWHVTVTGVSGGWVTGRWWRAGSWGRSKPLCMAHAEFTARCAYVRDLGDCPTCTGPIRETTDMVCPTCGTNYAPNTTDFLTLARTIESALLAFPWRSGATGAHADHDHSAWCGICDRDVAAIARVAARAVTGELTDGPAAAEVGGETTVINGYFCAAILDHDHPCPTMCAAPVAQQGQRCSPDHAELSYRPCSSCPEYARNAWAGTATTGGEADQ